MQPLVEEFPKRFPRQNKMCHTIIIDSCDKPKLVRTDIINRIVSFPRLTELSTIITHQEEECVEMEKYFIFNKT